MEGWSQKAKLEHWRRPGPNSKEHFLQKDELLLATSVAHDQETCAQGAGKAKIQLRSGTQPVNGSHFHEHLHPFLCRKATEFNLQHRPNKVLHMSCDQNKLYSM